MPQRHCRYFDFTPSLAQHVADASLIISHAGSGSIFESLTAGKALIVVPNPLLMDNHQAELGKHLADTGVLVRLPRLALLRAEPRLGGVSGQHVVVGRVDCIDRMLH